MREALVFVCSLRILLKASWNCYRWLALRLEVIGAFIMLSSVILAVVDRNRGAEALTAGAAGLSISYALSVSSIIVVVGPLGVVFPHLTLA